MFSFIVTLLSATYLAGVFIDLAICHRRYTPFILGSVAGIATLFSLGAILNNPIPPSVRWVTLPLFVAAVVTAFSSTKKDWDTLYSSKPNFRENHWRDAALIVFGIVGATFGVLTSIGKPILTALGQNVIGTTPNENREIYFVGGIVGFFIGAFFFLLVWSYANRR